MNTHERGETPPDTRFQLWDTEPWLDPASGEEADWSLYYLPASNTYQLVAETPVEDKATYVLGVLWFDREPVNRDASELEAHRAGLHRKVVQEIKNREYHLLTEDELKEIF